MNRDRLLLLLAALTAVAAIVVTWADLGGLALRLLFGLPLALLLPGYALTASVLRRELRGVERLLWSLGLSVGLAVMGGFVLNLLPWGLQPRSWALLLGGITLAGCGYGLLRPAPADPTRPAWRPQIALWQGVVWSTALLLLIVAVGMARAGAAAPNTPGFTQLWLLPGAQQSAQSVRLGVMNAERYTVTYRLRLDGDGTSIAEWPTITLASGEHWDTTYTLSGTAPALLTANLYRLDDPTSVYRRVTLAPTEQGTN